ncbi:phosphatidylglycerophosphatase A [Rhizosaccharibacter radicis]|uniref:Phosphatidylglycerophosphatase A n=1 Tax=Rhizosaccharibacter radicis TaxID=2782605 RepID=A0ABT1VV77_9PROT|nr:phosphatidylglycerophosphatase A [Acetobacteraceae bacterium KSS12]
MTRRRLAEWVASFGGCGWLRPAPGTIGSAAALLPGGVAVWWLPPSLAWPVLVAAVLAASTIGIWAIGAAADGADHGWIVIDEVAGQWLTLLGLLPCAGCVTLGGSALAAGIAVAFLLFRLLDITKPGPVGMLDRRHDAAGVMGDDLAAGLIGALLLVAVRAAWRLWS